MGQILGISAYYHDSAAALLDEGTIIAAAQEERFSRKKHDASKKPLKQDEPLKDRAIANPQSIKDKKPLTNYSSNMSVYALQRPR